MASRRLSGCASILLLVAITVTVLALGLDLAERIGR